MSYDLRRKKVTVEDSPFDHRDSCYVRLHQCRLFESESREVVVSVWWSLSTKGMQPQVNHAALVRLGKRHRLDPLVVGGLQLLPRRE